MLIYNPKVDSANKPDVAVEYNFYPEAGRRAGEVLQQDEPAEPERAGRCRPSSIWRPAISCRVVRPSARVVPPRGDYSLEIKVTDKIANKDADEGNRLHRQRVVASNQEPGADMRSTSSMTGVSGRRRSGASLCSGRRWRAGRTADSRGHPRWRRWRRVPSRYGTGRKGRAGGRRHGVRARRFDGVCNHGSERAVRAAHVVRPGRICFGRIYRASSPSRGQVIDVRPSTRASSSIALHHASVSGTTVSSPVLAAGLGGGATEPAAAPPADAGAAGSEGATGTDGDDHGEMAWRLRHARRAVLKDATMPVEMLGGERRD